MHKLFTAAIKKPLAIICILAACAGASQINPAAQTDGKKPDLVALHRFVGSNYLSAPSCYAQSAPFTNLPPLEVVVFLGEGLDKIVQIERVKTKVELALRERGVVIKEKSDAELNISFDGFWTSDLNQFVYRSSGRLIELVFLERKVSIFALAETWSSGSYGIAGKNKIEEVILTASQDQVDRFVNLYLAAKTTKNP